MIERMTASSLHHTDLANELQQSSEWLIYLNIPVAILSYFFPRLDEGEFEMTRKLIFAALTAGVCLAAVTSVPASAQALRSGATEFVQRDALVEQVQYRRHYYGGYRHYGGYRGGFDPGAAAALGIIGLAAGAIAGAALAPAPYVVGDPNWIAYCTSRYRSFDPMSGT